MKYKHYAPKADLVLVEGEQEAVVAEINALVREKQAAGLKVGVVATDETESLYQADYVVTIGREAMRMPLPDICTKYCVNLMIGMWMRFIQRVFQHRGSVRRS